jgi:CRP-like cAMP-binding protein
LIDKDFSDKNIRKYITTFPVFGIKEDGKEVKRIFNFDMLVDVARLRDGIGFGELALINDAPRSATIRSTIETHFAILEKDDFKAILGKATRKRFATMIKFMSQFIVFKNMTRLALEKLALFMQREEANIGK